jgi:hypothetical protein
MRYSASKNEDGFEVISGNDERVQYESGYGYLHFVKYPKPSFIDEAMVTPTFKEEKIKVEKDELEFLHQKLKEYREQK